MRWRFAGSTSTAFIGRSGRPAVQSVHEEPPLSDRNTRPPPKVRYVAQTRGVGAESAYRSLTNAPVRGVVSAASAPQAAPFHVVRYTRPSVVPTYTTSGLGMYI